MVLNIQDYRFRLREWLHPFSNARKRLLINKIINDSGQSRFTIRRIMYLRKGDNSYVRPETKEAICRILEKDILDFENPPTDN